MGGIGVEVAAESVAGEGRVGVFVQTQPQIVEEGMSILLVVSAQMKGWNGLGDRVNSQPEPMDTSPDSGVQLVQLNEGQGQGVEVAVVQQDAVVAHALEPAHTGRIGCAGTLLVASTVECGADASIVYPDRLSCQAAHPFGIIRRSRRRYRNFFSMSFCKRLQ